MLRFVYSIIFLFEFARSTHHFKMDDLVFDKLLYNINFEAKLEPLLFEPTFEPTSVEPSFKPSLTLEPTLHLEPSLYLEPTLEPSLEPTLYLEPTLEPTFVDHEDNYKILDFGINIEINNYKNSQLSEYDKNIILLSFEEITNVNTKYLSIENKNLRSRKLSIIFLKNNLYVLDETILVSIPLINEYHTYSPKPIDLYDLIVGLITDSFYSGLFENIIKEYNSSTLNNIQLDLLEISEPVIRNSLTENNDDNNDNKSIKKYELVLIIVFGILGLFFMLFLYYIMYSQFCNYETNKNSNKNKIYFVKEKEDFKNIIEILDQPIESQIVGKPISEEILDNENKNENYIESRVVEIANKEQSL